MIVLVGQQIVEGKCIFFGFKYCIFFYFIKDDYFFEVCGFVENLYFCGLIFLEFFFYVMVGREGLIDIVVKIVEIGYIQCCLVKVFEDVEVYYDGMVCNLLGDIIQFVYGEDGFDGIVIEK